MEKYKSEYERYEEAKKEVKEIRGFYGHLLSYIVIMSCTVFINLYYTPEHIWFVWPLLGWGLGVFFHALGTFKIVPFFGKDWEEKKINELMDKQKKQKWE